MTFTTRLKDEMSKNEFNPIESNSIITSYLLTTGKFKKDRIELLSENASVIRLVYRCLKQNYGINPIVNIRIQKRFRVKQIYILIIKEKVDVIKNDISVYQGNILETLVTDEEKQAFIMGSFMGVGSISDPKSKGYHLEFTYSDKKLAQNMEKLLSYYKMAVNLTVRNNKYVVYIKASENISDVIKMFRAYNSLFEFEDIRIYRDHKNMVNRLNNCEIANQEKTIKTGMKQIENIHYLQDNDLIDLLDDNLKLIVEYRLKYPEASLQELADIISMETDYKIGKSGINHHFIKINNLIKKHKEIENES